MGSLSPAFSTPRFPSRANGSAPAARPGLPVTPGRPATAAPSRLTAFANATATARNPPRDGGSSRNHPDRGRRPAGYVYYPGSFNQSRLRAGHYVPGESYVQETSACPYPYSYGASPSYYLGGAFPYFYGSAVGYPGAYFDAGAAAAFSAPDAAAAIPPDGAAADAAAPSEPAQPAAPPPAAGTPRSPGGPNAPAAGPLAGPNSLVEAVQAELLRRGYFGGRADGRFGADTGEALSRFQTDHGLPRTGLVNEATLFALGLN